MIQRLPVNPQAQEIPVLVAQYDIPEIPEKAEMQGLPENPEAPETAVLMG